MPITETVHRTHLQRLIKGALLVTIFILYVALVLVQFYYTIWLDALMVLCPVFSGQFFRYIY